MLKWTSMQKLPEPSTPRILNTTDNNEKIQKRTNNRKRRATINNITSNKENLITSTPVVKQCGNSPLLLEEFLALTPPAKELQKTSDVNLLQASTLPKFAEDYSPNIIYPGHILAMRGLLPDSYIGNPRYLTKTPKKPIQLNQEENSKRFDEKPLRKMLTRKRKLEIDFNKTENFDEKDKTVLSSSKMGDLTLDKLIDAILDSTRKDKNKKKTPRKSLNLRKRTLLKNSSNVDLILSPSYKPADDPCSDLNFSELKNINILDEKINNVKDNEISGKRKLSSGEKNCLNSKKSRRSSNSRKYFEVGLALPSVYV